jgi:hypothetical protein
MRRRRLLLGLTGVALLVVAGFGVLIWLTSPTPGVTLDNFRRLREGMSIRDVEALLGKPDRVFEGAARTHRVWRGEEVVISLTWDADDADRLWVGFAEPPGQEWNPNTGYYERIQKDESFLDRIRRWLHW